MNNYKKLKLAALMIVISGCTAARPVLYDNARYAADPGKAEQQVDECLKRAESRIDKESRLERSAKVAGKSGLASGAAGAAGAGMANAVQGGGWDVGASAAASAGAGTAGNFVWEMLDTEEDPVFKHYVETCLAEKGLKTLTWS